MKKEISPELLDRIEEENNPFWNVPYMNDNVIYSCKQFNELNKIMYNVKKKYLLDVAMNANINMRVL